MHCMQAMQYLAQRSQLSVHCVSGVATIIMPNLTNTTETKYDEVNPTVVNVRLK